MSHAETPDTGHPRRARTRRALLNAGLQLFAERPVDAVPIDDIVSAAGVAKGSFFNHFDDKQKFSAEIATAIRLDLENRVSKSNEDVDEPLGRLTGGMRVATEFALSERQRAIVMMRSLMFATGRDHPLNLGLKKDIDSACAAGLLNEETKDSALLLWLGACQIVMANIVERNLSRSKAADRMNEMMIMTLVGLGVGRADARRLATRNRELLLAMR